MARELVTLRTVSQLIPIPEAEKIETAQVDGWQVVVKKGEFRPGDPCVFFEVDSFLPAQDTRFAFLERTKRTWRGREGYRLRTVKLKGQISQGLALPVTMFPEGIEALSAVVEKWEEDLPPALQGFAKGTFPKFLRKTDQERIQNCFDKIDRDALYEITQKMDGTSLTVFRHEGEFGVCSRNLQLKLGEENAGNLYVQQAQQFAQVPEGYAAQAEICGPGIQANRAGLSQVVSLVFDIWDIKAQKYLPWHERREMCKTFAWSHVPSVCEPPFGPHDCLVSLEEALAYADRFKYPNGEPAEGVVFKRADGLDSFKIISNAFLLRWGL